MIIDILLPASPASASLVINSAAVISITLTTAPAELSLTTDIVTAREFSAAFSIDFQ